MIYRYWFIGVLLAAFSLMGVAGCDQDRLVTAKILLANDEQRVPCFIAGGRVFVPKGLSQDAPPIMIDTADYWGLTVTEAFAKEAGIQKASSDRFWFHDYGGRSAPAVGVHLRSLMMGGAEIRGVDGVAVATPAFRSGEDAVLGWPAFTDVLLTIDYARNQLTLRHGRLPPPDGKHVLRLRRDDQGFPVAWASFGGLRVQVCPDSGCTSCCICLTKAEALSLHLKWHSAPAKVSVMNFIGDVTGERGEAQGALKIGDFTITNPTVIVWDAKNAPVTLGSDFLSSFMVTFDFENMRMSIEPGPQLIPALFPDLTFRCAHRHIISIDPDGLAARSGIRVGDEIVLMNGVPNTIIEPDSPHPPDIEIVHGPATVTGPATWSQGGYSSEIPEGEMVNFAEGITVAVTYHARTTTKPAATQLDTSKLNARALIMNWAVGWDGPVPLEIRREGRLLWISLPVKKLE